VRTSYPRASIVIPLPTIGSACASSKHGGVGPCRVFCRRVRPGALRLAPVAWSSRPGGSWNETLYQARSGRCAIATNGIQRLRPDVSEA